MHEISGAVPIRSRLDAASAARPRSPLRGREPELARLDGALDAMLAGTGQVVSMVGEVGVGKSRLALEFARRCRARGCLVIEAPAVSYGRAAGYRPGVELHRRYFEVESGDDAATIRDKVAARMRDLDPELEEGVPAILWVLGVAQDGGGLAAMDPGLRRRHVMRTVHRLVARQGRRQPFVMILEDMQWVDTETHVAMDALVETLPPFVMVACTYRPEHADHWTGYPGFTPVRVGALEAPATDLLLDALLGTDPALAPLKRLVAERANGNPLFLEECVASLVETGALEGEPGAYRFTRPTLALEVPPTVRATIASRIDRLRYEDKRLLQAASVIGDEVPVRLLEAVADVPVEEVQRGLEQLHAGGLLDQRALFPDLVYGFRHALVHDVAYESLLHDRRRGPARPHPRGHRAVLRGPAGRADRAARPPRVPGRGVGSRGRLLPGGGHPHALAHGELGERVVLRAGPRPRSPTGPRTRRLGVDLRCDLHNALVPLGQHARSVAVLREAAALATSLGDRPRLARALSLESSVHWDMGASDEAARVGERALAIADETRDTGLWVVGHYNVGAGRRAVGDYRQALVVLRRVLAVLPPARERRALRPARHRGGPHPRPARLDPGRARAVRRGGAGGRGGAAPRRGAPRHLQRHLRAARAGRHPASAAARSARPRGLLERGIAQCGDMPAF